MILDHQVHIQVQDHIHCKATSKVIFASTQISASYIFFSQFAVLTHPFKCYDEIYIYKFGQDPEI